MLVGFVGLRGRAYQVKILSSSEAVIEIGGKPSVVKIAARQGQVDHHCRSVRRSRDDGLRIEDGTGRIVWQAQIDEIRLILTGLLHERLFIYRKTERFDLQINHCQSEP